jgi:hypothetical protein
MSSETIPIDGMQWTDSTHLAEHKENTSAKRSEGLGPIHVKTVFQAVQRKTKLTEFSESRICPRRQFLLMGCSEPTRLIAPNMRKYFP